MNWGVTALSLLALGVACTLLSPTPYDGVWFLGLVIAIQGGILLIVAHLMRDD